jgi:hypothetical protein
MSVILWYHMNTWYTNCFLNNTITKLAHEAHFKTWWAFHTVGPQKHNSNPLDHNMFDALINLTSKHTFSLIQQASHLSLQVSFSKKKLNFISKTWKLKERNAKKNRSFTNIILFASTKIPNHRTHTSYEQ